MMPEKKGYKRLSIMRGLKFKNVWLVRQKYTFKIYIYKLN